MMSRKTYGFGFRPEESSHHFRIGIPRRSDGDIVMKEVRNGEEYLRCVLPRAYWETIAFPLQASLNQRLQRRRLPLGRWHSGDTPVERLLGKELCLLAWAIEQAPIEQVAQALHTWSLLWEEERWWLYTETAAATGRAFEDRGRGWRKLLQMWMTTPPQCKRSRPPADQAFFVARSGKNPVCIYEVVDPAAKDRHEDLTLLRAEIPQQLWSTIATPVAASFRRRQQAIREEAEKPRAWRTWDDILPRGLGRELVLLAWGLEEGSSAVVHPVYANWSGLQPEERRHLYSWAQSAYESLPEGRGKRFRGGIRVMLQENPIDQVRPYAQHTGEGSR